MKAVFDTKAHSQYDDDTSSRYHFPSRYLRLAERASGDWAVFRRPRDGGEGIAYFGVGRVDRVIADPNRDGYYYALIRDYLTFDEPVSWRKEGRYAERALREIEEVPKLGLYLRGRSIRPLEDADFVAIVEAGLKDVLNPENARRFWPEPAGAFNLDLPYEPVRRTVAMLTNRNVRDANFRKRVCEAYENRCAVTRLRMFNGGGRAEVQAAHIRPVSDEGPDIVQNGLALSATAHWMFDRHLISVDTEHRLLVAHNRVPSELRSLLDPSFRRLHLPADPRLWPSERFLAFHREKFGVGG